jgi:two-component sensor histidine kinase
MIFPLKGADGLYRPFLTRIEPLRENGVVVGWFGTNTDVTEQERDRERLQLMIHELNHRVKNTLATVHSIALHSLRDLKPNSAKLFENRLLALAAVHDVLTRENWTKAQVDELVRTAIAPAGQDNFDVSGPPVDVCPRVAAALAMTLHELCTNAVRHGSLSAPSGRVAVEWGIDAKGRTPKLHLVWREYGGSPISPPSVKGFGMRLIEKTLASEAGARIAVEFPSEGFRCEMDIPLGVEVLK